MENGINNRQYESYKTSSFDNGGLGRRADADSFNRPSGYGNSYSHSGGRPDDSSNRPSAYHSAKNSYRNDVRQNTTSRFSAPSPPPQGGSASPNVQKPGLFSQARNSPEVPPMSRAGGGLFSSSNQHRGGQENYEHYGDRGQYRPQQDVNRAQPMPQQDYNSYENNGGQRQIYAERGQETYGSRGPPAKFGEPPSHRSGYDSQRSFQGTSGPTQGHQPNSFMNGASPSQQPFDANRNAPQNTYQQQQNFGARGAQNAYQDQQSFQQQEPQKTFGGFNKSHGVSDDTRGEYNRGSSDARHDAGGFRGERQGGFQTEQHGDQRPMNNQFSQMSMRDDRNTSPRDVPFGEYQPQEQKQQFPSPQEVPFGQYQPQAQFDNRGGGGFSNNDRGGNYYGSREFRRNDDRTQQRNFEERGPRSNQNRGFDEGGGQFRGGFDDRRNEGQFGGPRRNGRGGDFDSGRNFGNREFTRTGFGNRQNEGENEGEKVKIQRAPRGWVPPETKVDELYESDRAMIEAQETNEDQEGVTIEGAPNMLVNSWENSGLDDQLVKNLTENCNFAKPRTIQAAAIPLIMSGKDMIAQAVTGCGKTMSFVLPIVDKILKMSPEERADSMRSPVAIILEPTRELAIQVEGCFKRMTNGTDIRVVVSIGQKGRMENIKELVQGVDICVSTVGRMMDYFENGEISTGRLKFFVLDEADRLLSVVDSEHISAIFSNPAFRKTAASRQTILFSATMPESCVRMAKNILKTDHATIRHNTERTLNKLVKHQFIEVEGAKEKNVELKRIFKEDNELGKTMKTLIFTEQKARANFLSFELQQMDIEAVAITGDAPQDVRIELYNDFTRGKIAVLIGTDVCARGLDVPNLERVINYDLPSTKMEGVDGAADKFVHRVGRTGRIRKGEAITFVQPNEDKTLAKELARIVREVGQEPPDFLVALSEAPETTTGVFGSAAGFSEAGAGFGSAVTSGFGSSPSGAGFGADVGGGFSGGTGGGFEAAFEVRAEDEKKAEEKAAESAAKFEDKPESGKSGFGDETTVDEEKPTDSKPPSEEAAAGGSQSHKGTDSDTECDW